MKNPCCSCRRSWFLASTSLMKTPGGRFIGITNVIPGRRRLQPGTTHAAPCSHSWFLASTSLMKTPGGRFQRAADARNPSSFRCRGCSWLAEKGGFEPPVRARRTTVFETAPFDHSGISPKYNKERTTVLLLRSRAHSRWSFGSRPPRSTTPAFLQNIIKSVQRFCSLGRELTPGGRSVRDRPVRPLRCEVKKMW